MAWRSWKLAQWNEALVRTVFWDRERLAQRLTRIQASDKFLALATGDSSAHPRDAFRAFIDAFGTNPRSIRAHYEWSGPVEIATRRAGFPQIFAPLYLTLLAATADEQTFNEGNFRNRFAELLLPVEIGTLNFSDLPNLWAHVARWTQSASCKKSSCRELILPPTPHERLIGVSKRLAFPAYRDETKLQVLLQQSNMDSNADFTSVATAISRQLTLFSPAFREEFALFQVYLSKSKLKDAFESPLWSAVQSVTWESDRVASTQNGTFTLGIDFGEPDAADLYLHTDETGKNLLSSAASFKAISLGGSSLFLAIPADNGSWTPQRLLQTTRERRGLLSLQLWKRLQSGALALFPDHQGNLIQSGQHHDGGPACLLLNNATNAAASLSSAALTYNIKVREMRTRIPFNGWKVLLLESVSSASLARLAAALPVPARHALSLGWRPPQISSSGGAWYGQCLLLNPASSPRFRLRDAEAGEYEFYGSAGASVGRGRMEVADDGYFQIPALSLVDVAGITSLRVTLRGPDLVAELILIVVTEVPLAPPIKLAQPENWLTDGPAGMLVSIRDCLLQTGDPRTRQSSWQPQFALTAGEALTTARTDPSELREPFDWLADALLLRFQRRATLPFSELEEHVTPASNAARVSTWLVTRSLLCAGWLLPVARRTSSYFEVTPAPRTVSLVPNRHHVTVRLAGIYSRSEIAFLESVSIDQSATTRYFVRGPTTCIGAIEAELPNIATMGKIADRLQLQIIDNTHFRPPLLIPSANKAIPFVEPAPGGTTDVWDNAAKAWAAHTSSLKCLSPGTLIRIRGTQRTMFRVSGEAEMLWTDSLQWARICALTARRAPIGIVEVNGDCTFDRSIQGLPVALVQWWLHVAGGFVGMGTDGAVYFGGALGRDIWDALPGWIAHPVPHAPSEQPYAAALRRRQFALRLRGA